MKNGIVSWYCELAVILSIFKSDDTKFYDNCRGISLLSVSENVCERITEVSLRDNIWGQLEEEQHIFRLSWKCSRSHSKYFIGFLFIVVPDDNKQMQRKDK